MQTLHSSVFHLLMEPDSLVQTAIRTRAAVHASGVHQDALVLPTSVSILRTVPDHAPVVHAEPLESLNHELVLEPVLTRNSLLRLVLVNPTNRKLCVNGERVPRVSLLREKDQFHWDDSCVFHVTIFHRPQIGPAPADQAGNPCPICLAPFADQPNVVCYRCQCGTVLHLSDPSGLECARVVNECPNCKHPITLEEGYTWLPQFCHE